MSEYFESRVVSTYKRSSRFPEGEWSVWLWPWRMRGQTLPAATGIPTATCCLVASAVPAASRKPAAPHRKGSIPSVQADSALLRENAQRVDGLIERVAALEKALRELLAVLERIAPAIGELIQHSGDLSRERANTANGLSGVVSRLDRIDGKMMDAAEAMAPLRQDVARLEERIGELARALDSREPGDDGRDSEVADQVRLLGKMLTVRMDEVGRNLDSIRTAMPDSADSRRLHAETPFPAGERNALAGSCHRGSGPGRARCNGAGWSAFSVTCTRELVSAFSSWSRRFREADRERAIADFPAQVRITALADAGCGSSLPSLPWSSLPPGSRRPGIRSAGSWLGHGT